MIKLYAVSFICNSIHLSITMNLVQIPYVLRTALVLNTSSIFWMKDGNGFTIMNKPESINLLQKVCGEKIDTKNMTTIMRILDKFNFKKTNILVDNRTDGYIFIHRSITNGMNLFHRDHPERDMTLVSEYITKLSVKFILKKANITSPVLTPSVTKKVVQKYVPRAVSRSELIKQAREVCRIAGVKFQH